jgi:hypothetical protein
VDLEIKPASAEAHELMASWRYPPPYDFYDGDVDPVLNPERFFEARASTTSSRNRRTSTTASASVPT